MPEEKNRQMGISSTTISIVTGHYFRFILLHCINTRHRRNNVQEVENGSSAHSLSSVMQLSITKEMTTSTLLPWPHKKSQLHTHRWWNCAQLVCNFSHQLPCAQEHMSCDVTRTHLKHPALYPTQCRWFSSWQCNQIKEDLNKSAQLFTNLHLCMFPSISTQ